MMKQPIADEMQVATNTAPKSMPACESTLGLTMVM